MKNAFAVLALTLFSVKASAGGLSASIGGCPDEFHTSSIAGNIATSVVKTLLSGLIDGAIRTLSENRVETFDVVVPVDDIKELIGDGSRCLLISSSSPDIPGRVPADASFSAVFKFIKHSTASAALRPIVVEWTYKEFLGRPCSWYLRCSRRDVVFALEMFAPGNKPPAGEGAAQPLGVSIENADLQAIQSALKPNDSLPWFLAQPESGATNLRFRLIETTEPHAFSKALGAALNAEKENITTTVDNKLKGISDQVAAQAAQKDVAEATATFNSYKAAWDAANTTKEAYAKAMSDADKKQLALTYAIQYKSVVLSKTLARAAFDIANISWPDDGLGELPSSL